MTEQLPVKGALIGFTSMLGVNLVVVEVGGIEYVPLKPLSDLAGIDWRNSKRKMAQEHNIALFEPLLVVCGIFSEKGVLCVRRKRAWMFLARINTNRMRAQGNVQGAEALLKRQIEWAKVLHENGAPDI